MTGPTAGEQYLSYLGLSYPGLDDYPGIYDLARELDDEILFVCEQVIRDRQREDSLLVVLLHEECRMHTWATYPVGGLPVGISVRYVVDPDFPHRHTVQGKVRAATFWDRDGKGPFVAWEPGTRYEPRLVPDDLVEAWVPIPFDLSVLVPAVEPPRPPAPPAVAWDDLAVGQIITYRHRNRSQRLARRIPVVRRAEILDIWHPRDRGRNAQIGILVLNKDGTPNRGIGGDGRHTLHGGPQAIDDVVSIERQQPAPATRQDLTEG